jgi:hypothetical protein
MITTADITAALRGADIDYRVEHPDTTIEAIIVAHDGREVAFSPGTDGQGNITGAGINLAYYRATAADSDVVTQDWVETVGELVASLERFGATAVGVAYSYADDAYRVEVRQGPWDDYDVMEVIDVPSGEESDARAEAARIAEARRIALRD